MKKLFCMLLATLMLLSFASAEKYVPTSTTKLPDMLSAPKCPEITKMDLFDTGLSGGPDSKAKRLALLKMMNLPEHMSSNAMLDALNLLCTRDEFYRIVDTL